METDDATFVDKHWVLNWFCIFAGTMGPSGVTLPDVGILSGHGPLESTTEPLETEDRTDFLAGDCCIPPASAPQSGGFCTIVQLAGPVPHVCFEKRVLCMRPLGGACSQSLSATGGYRHGAGSKIVSRRNCLN